MPTLPRETQPDASRLLDHDALMERVRILSHRPRVWAGVAGVSHRGREIPYFVIASPDAIERLEHFRRASVHAFGGSPGDGAGGVTVIPTDTKWPVLIVGASFGNEAAHTEALLDLVEALATSDEANIRTILGKVITIVVPLINPDGREAALAEWQKYPLSAALGGSVNAWGSMLNRDFIAATQPETQAILRIYREWHPIAAYDPHEDMYILGAAKAQTCWTPPFARPVHPELHPSVVDAIDDMGHAIAEAWRSQHFNMLYHPQGEHGFMNLFRLGGRFHLTLALHGVPALITESARTPGTLTWEERKGQKISAALAVLSRVAAEPERFHFVVNAARQGDGAPGEGFVVLADEVDPWALRQLLQSLLRHEVKIFEMPAPRRGYFIPLNQAEARFIRGVLVSDGWNLVALSPALGVPVLKTDMLPRTQTTQPDSASLMEVTRLPRNRSSALTPAVPRRGTAGVAFSNGVAGIRALNRLWQIGARVSWVTNPTELDGRLLSPGTLVVEGASPRVVTQVLATEDMPAQFLRSRLPEGARVRLRPPRVAIYIGQGVDDRYAPLSGDTRYACHVLGFTVAEVTETELTSRLLRQCNILIIPAGDAAEIVDGWSGEPSWHRAPWTLPGPPRGIGKRGAEAIKAFIERGGSYIGLGYGGGSLAGVEHLGLVHVRTRTHSLGEGRVNLKLEVPSHPVFYGIPGSIDASGRRHKGTITAYYYSESTGGIKGGPIFEAGSGVEVLATYAGLEDGSASRHFREVEPFSPEQRTPAIVQVKVGRGLVTLFSIAPDFRGIWLSTYPLLSNAILASARLARGQR